MPGEELKVLCAVVPPFGLGDRHHCLPHLLVKILRIIQIVLSKFAEPESQRTLPLLEVA